MLDTFRNSAKGTPGKIIVGLVVITFVLFGAESIMSIAGNSSPATVNGQDISEAEYQIMLNTRQQELAQQYGAEAAAQLSNSPFLRNQVVSNLVNQEIQSQLASNMGFEISEQQILESLGSVEAFQVNGVFDQNTYLRVLSSSGYTHQTFIAREQKSNALSQFQAGVFGSAFNIEESALQLAKLDKQMRDVAYKTFVAADFESDVELTDEEIQTFYDENSNLFMSEEKVKLKYVVLSKESIAEQAIVTDEDLQSAYESYVASVSSSSEREISHILFAEKEDNQAAAQSALDRLNEGEDFSAMAKELSDDPGSAEFGGSLGVLVDGVFVAEFNEAASALTEAGQLSGLVETQYGTHIIRLDSIKSEQAKPFAEMKADLEADVRDRKARDELILLESQLADEAYANDNIEDVASAFFVDVQNTDWLTRSTVNPLMSESAFQAIAFSDQVTVDGVISDVATLANGDLVVVQKSDYVAEQVEPLESVKETIVAQLTAEKSVELMAAAAESAASEGADISAWTLANGIDRNQSDLPVDVVETAFSLPKPETISFGSAVQGNEAYAVAVTNVIDGEVTEADIASAASWLEQASSNSQYQVVFNAARAAADIKVRQ
ncbi:SurA N-terminal domain-containing protein [Reinekea marina]|uniref:Periplasmic chaperone PpiD n=1 Tax=Reinekea marina TaxID=1310421 RepID=A0ABV7WUM9_9GAMM|nr:SurA N-terminal domain-containing protein [Reinekea marina]MDN3649626.1 SurA N-terminal domain-containing protein [Reinekea marina]